MHDNDNVIPFRDGVATGRRRFRVSKAHQRLVDVCRDDLEKVLGELLNDVFERLDDALYALSDKTAGSAAHPEYFESLRELRLMRLEIAQRFQNAALSSYNLFWRLGPQAASDHAAELKLIEQDELEESLATDEIANKAEKRFEASLYLLDRRFSHLLGGATVGSDNNPVAPLALARAFAAALGAFHNDLRVKLIAYKTFGQRLEHHIGNLYDELNSRLRHGDVLPGLTAEPSPGAPDGARANAPTPPRSPQQFPPADGFGALTTLLHQYRLRQGGPLAAASGTGSGIEVDQTELLRALGELQRSSVAMGLFTHDLSAMRGASVKKDLRKALAKNTDPGQMRLREADLDTIDTVSMLFDFVLEEKSLPDAMKAQVARLQVPMLKLALIDQSFFRQAAHPARQLLNRLARLAFTWTDDGDRSESSLYGRIESLISRVLVEFREDPGVFEAVSQELSEFMEREQQGARMTEERTRQVSQGKEQLLTARRRVEQEIHSRLAPRRQLPEVVQALLRDGWKDVLLLTYLRQGPDSPQWTEAVELIDELLWSVEPKPDSVAREQLLSAIPQLLAGLRNGLSGISYDKNRMAKLLKDLQAVHISCLRGEEAGLDMAPIPVLGHGPAEPRMHARRPPTEDEYTELAAGLEVGSWVEIRSADGTQSRAKLSWRSDFGDVYVFVNRRGVKVRELGTGELAELMRRGQAEVLEDPQVPLVERALVSMMRRMREDLGR
jgi:hypothetical protein